MGKNVLNTIQNYLKKKIELKIFYKIQILQQLKIFLQKTNKFEWAKKRLFTNRVS